MSIEKNEMIEFINDILLEELDCKECNIDRIMNNINEIIVINCPHENKDNFIKHVMSSVNSTDAVYVLMEKRLNTTILNLLNLIPK